MPDHGKTIASHAHHSKIGCISISTCFQMSSLPAHHIKLIGCISISTCFQMSSLPAHHSKLIGCISISTGFQMSSLPAHHSKLIGCISISTCFQMSSLPADCWQAKNITTVSKKRNPYVNLTSFKLCKAILEKKFRKFSNQPVISWSEPEQRIHLRNKIKLESVGYLCNRR